ncbi:hypothetical protein Scep_013548 [Stephania cephalantha]|uniref:Sodium/calcium exchanger membrane region domain-containing protein n=1 Tax=Stephania cephalantha TaxID=152367 RepID=A0AAP0PAS1_9MAGN
MAKPSLELIGQLGALKDKSLHEFEDESLDSPASIRRKSNLMEETTDGSFSGSSRSHRKNTVLKSIKIMLFSTKLNLLMPFGPAAIIVRMGILSVLVGHNTFGRTTGIHDRCRQLALFTGDTVGGLLNATFGNATELIISVYALKGGLLRVVQQSLLGSILSNMLLVLGCSFFCGGIVFYKEEQVFNKNSATVNSGLLLMAVMGLLFPAVLHFTHTELHFGKSELALSRFSSCVMLVAYGAYLFYQLKNQKNPVIPINDGESLTESLDEEVPEISKWESIVWLAILALWISLLSEYLVDALEGAASEWNIPIGFISVIVLPIVGNAAEHASAVMFAMKNKLEICQKKLSRISEVTKLHLVGSCLSPDILPNLFLYNDWK